MDHCINSYRRYTRRIKFVLNTRGWSFSPKSYHDPTTKNFENGSSLLFYASAGAD
jgi:hypothetical protein